MVTTPMWEVEVKLAIAEPDAVRARIEAMAGPGATATETDRFYRHAAMPRFGGTDTLRVRERAGAWSVTWKGPAVRDGIKVRQEHEVGTEADPRPLIAALGFEEGAKISKRRTTWRIDELTVTMDDLADLGTFVEVESLTDDETMGREAVEAMVARLGLADARREPRPYVVIWRDAQE